MGNTRAYVIKKLSDLRPADHLFAYDFMKPTIFDAILIKLQVDDDKDYENDLHVIRLHLGSSINHVVKFLDILTPLPPLWSLLLNKAYVIKWSFGLPPQLSTWFMNDPFVKIVVLKTFCKNRKN